MSFKQSFAEILQEAKKAFEDVERTPHEKEKLYKATTKPFIKKVGFISGTKEIVVWR